MAGNKAVLSVIHLSLVGVSVCSNPESFEDGRKKFW